MKNSIAWFKKLCRIVKTHDAEIAGIKIKLLSAESRANAAEKLIRERTEVSVDVSCSKYDRHTVVLVGRTLSNDYVETFSVPGGEFEHLVNMLKHMSTYASVNRVDAPPGFRVLINKELRK